MLNLGEWAVWQRGCAGTRAVREPSVWNGGAFRGSAWEQGSGRRRFSSLQCLVVPRCFGALPLVSVLMTCFFLGMPSLSRLKWERCVCLHSYTDGQLREAGESERPLILSPVALAPHRSRF